jgi:ATP-binding cassette subfamily B protein
MNDDSQAVETEDLKKVTSQRRPHHGPGRGAGEKPKNFKKAIVALLKYLGVYKISIFVVIVFAIAATILSIIGPKILGNMTNDIVEDYVAIQVQDQINDALDKLPASLRPTIPKGTKGIDGLTDFFTKWQNDLKKEIADIKTESAEVQSESAELNADQKLLAEAQSNPAALSVADREKLATLNPTELATKAADLKTRAADLETKSAKFKGLSDQSNANGGTDVDVNKMKDRVPASVKDELKNVDWSEKQSMHYGRLALTAGELIALYAGSALLGFVQAWVLATVAQKAARRLRRELSAKINRVPLSYFDKQSFGNTLSRITNDVDTISQNLNSSISQLVTNVTSVIGILVMMITISITLTGIALLTIPVFLVLVLGLMKKSQKHFLGLQNGLGYLNGQIEESYGGHNVIHAFGREAATLAEFDEKNDFIYEHAWRGGFMSGLAYPAVNFISNLGYVGVALVGGYQAINGQISIGNIQAFIQYMQRFSPPMMSLAQITTTVQTVAAASERVFEFLNEAEEPDTGCSPEFTPKSIKGAVEFDHVKFSYDKEKPIIKDFSAKVKPGQMVAIVGPTGAGKTTMVNLLMRFYDPDSGEIKIDGVPTTKIPRGDVRKQFGMVLQDTWLFQGTIKENLGYGRKGATDDEILTAAKAAHVDHFVRSLPKDYDTVLDEEADNVSAGEKQLLTIARAMVADPPMLILDEATSSVDTRTEVMIQSAMNKLMKGRTSFVIAHRLSTVRGADLILVMDEGDIIESGTHEELLKKNGFYANLYNSQFVEGEEI